MAEQTKSVLRRKLEGKMTTSSGVKNMSTLWGEIKKEALRTLGDAIGRDIATGTHTMGKLSMQKFRSSFEGNIPTYLMGTQMEDFSALIYFSPELTSQITAKKLASDEEGEVALMEPGLLDLFLLQPVAQSLIEGLRRAHEAAVGPDDAPALVLRDQILSLDDLDTIEDDSDIYEYTLNIADPSSDSSMVIGFCFPYGNLEKYSILSANRMNATDLDVNDPWVGHMQSAVLQAKFPLQVVLDSFRLSIGACSRLAVGQVIELPGAGLDNLTVRAQTQAGVVDVGRSELGIYKQYKAIKLYDNLDDKFIMDLPKLVAQ